MSVSPLKPQLLQPPVNGGPPRKKLCCGTQRAELEAHRRALPMYIARKRLLKELQDRDSVIIIGATGTGKTTQLPQLLHETGVDRLGAIAITQPRRVASVTLATRVAQEMGVALGSVVGYSIRFEDCTSPRTKIKFLTDGMLLREALLDPLLHRYCVVILDEAHERTVHTDVLFGVVKSAQKLRKDRHHQPLKIIVMSATMNVDNFSEYFNDAEILYMEGRQHPVQVMYLKKSQADYLMASFITARQIHEDEPLPGDILMFLTGQEEIEAATRMLRHYNDNVIPKGHPGLMVVPLYASLSSSQQLLAFKPASKGFRKVIVATNVAETSLTMSGVYFVVDCGFVKSRTCDPVSGLDILRVERVSKAQACQRAGRAGREIAGTCFRVYTEEEYAAFQLDSVPEIKRCALTGVVLQLLALGISNLKSFDFMDPPTPGALEEALNQLVLLGAIDKPEQITRVGKQMTVFPVHPKLARAIVASCDFHCTEEVAQIVALLSVDSVLVTPTAKREEANEAREKFDSSEGDPFMLLKILRGFSSISVSNNKKWCIKNFVHYQRLSLAVEIAKQIRKLCESASIPVRSCGGDTTVIRRCLLKGLFMNCAQLQPNGSYVTLASRTPVLIHPSSCLFGTKPPCVIYTELVHTSQCYMRGVTAVSSDWAVEAAPTYFRGRRRLLPS